MAVWPAYAKLLLPGYGEDFDPSIERTEMERGVPKERIVNTHVLATIEGMVLFSRGADVVAFEAWYFDEVRRVGWFTVTHPRTRAQITARFQAGRLGRLTPISPRSGAASRDIVLEYLRG